jgi:hypothetical protein
MNGALTHVLCRFLAIALMLLPCQAAQAGMIGTDQAATPAAAQAGRQTVSSYLSRAQTVSEMQALGLDAQAAQDRVDAMTDAEVSAIAGKINEQPAGGVLLLILVVLLIYLIVR